MVGWQGLAVAEAVDDDSRPRPLLITSRLYATQRGDALLERRVGGEQRAPAAVVGDAGRRDRLRQRARRHAVQARQRVLHRHAAAEQLGRAGVGAELALARE